MHTVDRYSLMAWTEGILFDRDIMGHCSIGDGIDGEHIEDLLEAGETVFLTSNAEIVSAIYLNKETNEIDEMSIDDWNNRNI